ARLEQRHAVVEDDRADGDTGVERPVRKRVADCPRVRTSAVALELGDDLHRPHLRRSRHGAGGEARTEDVEGADAVLQLAGHLRHEVRGVAGAPGWQEAAHPTVPW